MIFFYPAIGRMYLMPHLVLLNPYRLAHIYIAKIIPALKC